MTEIWFYHLEQRPLEKVLPNLLEKCLEKGWKVVVESADETHLAMLDELLWTFSDDSFLPHGSARNGEAAMQPVYLTTGAENPNDAAVRFCVGGADPAPSLAPEASAYERIFVLFDGNDADLLAAARQQWAALKGKPHERAYWRQNEEGRWEKKV